MQRRQVWRIGLGLGAAGLVAVAAVLVWALGFRSDNDNGKNANPASPRPAASAQRSFSPNAASQGQINGASKVAALFKAASAAVPTASLTASSAAALVQAGTATSGTLSDSVAAPLLRSTPVAPQAQTAATSLVDSMSASFADASEVQSGVLGSSPAASASVTASASTSALVEPAAAAFGNADAAPAGILTPAQATPLLRAAPLSPVSNAAVAAVIGAVSDSASVFGDAQQAAGGVLDSAQAGTLSNVSAGGLQTQNLVDPVAASFGEASEAQAGTLAPAVAAPLLRSAPITPQANVLSGDNTLGAAALVASSENQSGTIEGLQTQALVSPSTTAGGADGIQASSSISPMAASFAGADASGGVLSGASAGAFSANAKSPSVATSSIFNGRSTQASAAGTFRMIVCGQIVGSKCTPSYQSGKVPHRAQVLTVIALFQGLAAHNQLQLVIIDPTAQKVLGRTKPVAITKGNGGVYWSFRGPFAVGRVAFVPMVNGQIQKTGALVQFT